MCPSPATGWLLAGSEVGWEVFMSLIGVRLVKLVTVEIERNWRFSEIFRSTSVVLSYTAEGTAVSLRLIGWSAALKTFPPFSPPLGEASLPWGK